MSFNCPGPHTYEQRARLWLQAIASPEPLVFKCMVDGAMVETTGSVLYMTRVEHESPHPKICKRERDNGYPLLHLESKETIDTFTIVELANPS